MSELGRESDFDGDSDFVRANDFDKESDFTSYSDFTYYAILLGLVIFMKREKWLSWQNHKRTQIKGSRK